ncbi:tryptophan synthase subunit alpha [Patescibacteria group bacterium]|nr:MAG: tryptophan synthase subunit alpha [Patescibacteria group bacterium]
MKNKIMTHVIAGYPTEIQCIKLLFSMQAAGVFAIEVQIPFSDPNADGPTIMKANDIALGNAMTTRKSFELIHRSREKGLTTPIYIMSYANKLFNFGIKNFCQESKRCHVTGLIIPDLPFDSPEYQELLTTCLDFGIELVPVLSPGMAPSRLNKYDINHQALLYLTSTRGITGKELAINTELLKLVKKIRSISSAQLALGFGIRTPKDVEKALKIADIAVIGSGVIEVIQTGGIVGANNYIKQLTGSTTS